MITLAAYVLALGAVAAFCELFGERANFLLTADDHDAIEFEGI
jgi:hypothetical protein